MTSSRSISPAASPERVEAARQAHALLAERGLGERVEVIDGETACGGLGMLLLAACAAARGGADKDSVGARVRATRERLRIWFCLDTLEYLRRGGRVGKAQAWLGGTLKIKPILSLEYEIVPVERVRTAGRAFERMVAYAQELSDAGADALGRAAHPGARAVPAPGRALPRDLRLRAAVRLRGRAGDRHLHRPRADRRRRDPARAARLISRGRDDGDVRMRAPSSKPDGGGAEQQFAAMALDVPAPVGQPRDLAAQVLHGDRELACGCSRSSRGSPRVSAAGPGPSALASPHRNRRGRGRSLLRWSSR